MAEVPSDGPSTPLGHPEVAHPAPEGPDAGTVDPTDGRAPYDWKGRYPSDAIACIRIEASYNVILLAVAMVLLLATWQNYICFLLSVSIENEATLRKYCYYSFAGLLGGTVFATKYLIRVVARGYWHIDRRLWRLLSPLNALAMGFAMGALAEGNFLKPQAHSSGAGIVAFGFLTGYFSDAVTGKLHEVANVIFGTSIKPPKD